MKSRTIKHILVVVAFAFLATPTQLAAQHTRYKVIDIGTLGGPSTYGQGNGAGTARFINNAGTVVGSSDTDVPDPNCINPDCFVSHAFEWQGGLSKDLGTLPGGSISAANAINARGWITGFSTIAEIDPVSGFPAGHAVLWKDGHIVDLGTLSSENGKGVQSAGNYINNAGEVVGVSSIDITIDPFAFIGLGPFASPTHAFIWKDGVMTDLGTLGGPDSFIAGLCDDQRAEMVAGTSFISFIPNATTGVPTADPFLWKNGRMIDLGTLGGTIGSAQCANNRGQVTGQSNLAGDPGCSQGSCQQHPFFWNRGVMTDIGTFGGDNGLPTWMNNFGEVVGRADLPNGQHHAFLYRDGVLHDLGTLGGNSTALQINSRHQIVGASRIDPETNHAFIWEKGEFIDLNTLIASNPSGMTLVGAFNINDRGEITGLGAPPGVVPSGTDAPGLHPFLLIPCGDGSDKTCGEP